MPRGDFAILANFKRQFSVKLEIVLTAVLWYICCSFVKKYGKMSLQSRIGFAQRGKNLKITPCRVLAGVMAALLLCTTLLLPVGAHTLITPEQQMRTVYHEENGFPSDTVKDIAMTPDGLLWFATADGLIRYNGYDFVCINKLTEPTFPAMRASVLCPAAEGSLWVGTNGSGLLHYANGAWSAITAEQGALSDSICDINLLADGSVAVAVPTGVYFVNADGTLGETYPLNDRAIVVQDIAVGKAGNVFGVTGDGSLFSILDGGFAFAPPLTREKNYTYTAVDSTDGRFLLGTSVGEIIVVEPQSDGDYSTKRINTGFDVIQHISHDADNNFHIISEDGWGILFADGDFVCMEAGGIEGISAFCCDFQGNYWIGTRQNGAVKISGSACRNWNAKYNLDTFSATAVIKADGVTCVGTTTGLIMLDETTGTRIENALTKVTAGEAIRYLLADRAGGLWAVAGRGVYHLEANGNLRTFSAENGLPDYPVNVLLQAKNGDIAVGTDNGLCFIRDDRVYYIVGAADGMFGRVSSLFQNENGTLTVGTVGNGVFCVEKDGSVKAYSAKDGFPAGKVACIVRDSQLANRVWFSIGSQLFYRDDEKAAMHLAGLYLSGEITDLFFAGDQMWIVTTNGVAVLNRTDLFTDAQTLPYETVGKRQGVLAAVSADSQNFVDENGVLYLCTGKGVNQIDTQNYQNDISVPRIHFLSATCGEESFPLTDGTVISGSDENVKLTFTAITYADASDFYLEYMLVGVDTEYTRVAPAAESTVYYDALPRGKYTLFVRAVDKNGTVLGATESVAFKKEATYSERVEFWIGIGFIVILVVVAVAMLAMAIRSVLLNRRQKRYRDITEQSISAIVNSVDAKDPYTRGHSDRVARYAAEIARRCGLGALKVSDLYYSALLHDIGKIGIPDDILKKPDKLTEEEYEIIKTHAAIGADIVKDITAIPHIARGIHDHHERYDGNGYPRGLRGNNISLEGRIIGMADAYDAMASARGYNGPQPKAYILSEIRAGAGKQFDPKIAEVVVQMIEDGFFDEDDAEISDILQDAAAGDSPISEQTQDTPPKDEPTEK